MENNEYEQLLKNIASPLDYSEGLYLVYVELFHTNAEMYNIISEHVTIIKELEFGYLCEAHMQAIPEIARSLSLKNHAVYQIVRLVKLTRSSDNEPV